MVHLKRMALIILAAILLQLLQWHILPIGAHTLVNIGIASLAGCFAYGCLFAAMRFWTLESPIRWISTCYAFGGVFGLYFFSRYGTTLDASPMYSKTMQEAAFTAGILLAVITIILAFTDNLLSKQPHAG